MSARVQALEEYTKVLTKEKHNVWAANGVGAALAELGHLDAARAVFSEVHGAMAAASGFLAVPDVIINLANVHLARQEYPDAIHLYKAALRELPHKHHPTVLLYLARAYYDSDNLLKAQAALARATHLAPTDYKLRFNFALTLQVRGRGRRAWRGNAECLQARPGQVVQPCTRKSS